MLKVIAIVGLLGLVSAQLGELDDRCPLVNTSPPTQLPHESDCGLFYICETGRRIVLSCPPGQHWRADKDWCDWPDVAGCNLGGGTDDRCPADNSGPPVHLPHEDCSKFYKCDWGIPVEMDCPDGQHWNAAADYCDHPENANCEAAPNGCPAENTMPPTHLPHESDCGKFYKCSWGNPIEMSCPSGQHWRVDRDWCDWPDVANCNAGSTSAPTDSPTGDTSDDCTTTKKPSSKESGSKEKSKEKHSSKEC